MLYIENGFQYFVRSCSGISSLSQRLIVTSVTISFNRIMKLEVEQLELSTIAASLGKSRHYFEYVRKDQKTADYLQMIRLKLIQQGEKAGVFKDYLIPANQ